MQYLRLILIPAFCCATALAQKPVDLPPATAPSPAASPGLIDLNVVVTDKAGNPIRGLRQEDFTLLDNHQPAAIRSFAAHEIESSRSDDQGLFIVIDNVNAGFNVISTARIQIENYLRGNGGRLPIPVALFMLTDSGLNQITKVSRDGNELAGILHEKEGQLREIPRSAGFYGDEEKYQISLRALENLTQYLGKADGRKLVVWIGPGWHIFDSPNVSISPQGQRNLFSEIVNLSTQLRLAGVTIHAVDPIGAVDAASAHNFLWEDFTKPVLRPNQSQPGDLALQVFAVHTGGIVLSGSNDIAGEIAKCAADASAWYSLRFDGQKPDAPNAWHDLEVKVDKPGLKVRTDNGYYAQP